MKTTETRRAMSSQTIAALKRNRREYLTAKRRVSAGAILRDCACILEARGWQHLGGGVFERDGQRFALEVRALETSMAAPTDSSSSPVACSTMADADELGLAEER